MTSIPAASATPVAAGSINPQLAQIVAQLPADQQQAAMAKIAALSPDQQQQLLAEIARQTSQQQTAAAASASTGQDAATLGASSLQPPNRMATILKNVAIFGGIGAALGFGASFFTLPVVGQVAAPIAAAVGGAVGAIAGIIKGMTAAKTQQAEYETAVAQEQQAAAAAAAQQQAAAAAADAAAAEEEPVTPEPVVVRRAKRARSGGARYTVVRGDNLSAIAARHGITWQELYAANRKAVGSNPHLIHPGLKLRIPKAS